ncbi:hypothetical protein DFH06DRAFT_375918 [Mycena polygramma]|nr:hypothetical protein DFH06DRAFT_375918 [Mycena polygramma]
MSIPVDSGSSSLEDFKPQTCAPVPKHEDMVPGVGIKAEAEVVLDIKAELKSDSDDAEDAKFNLQSAANTLPIVSSSIKPEDEAKMNLNTDISEINEATKTEGGPMPMALCSITPEDGATMTSLDIKEATNAKDDTSSLDVPMPSSCSPSNFKYNLAETENNMDVDSPHADVELNIPESESEIDKPPGVALFQKTPEPFVKDEPEDIMIPHTPRPARRRYLMDGLSVPTLQSVGIERRREIHEPEEVIIPQTPTAGRRFVLDAVVVPTLQSVGIKRRQETGEEISNKPQVKKIKKLERSEGLGAGTLRARLISDGIPTEPYPVGLGADARDVSVRRDFMRIHYGGNSQAAFPAIAEEKYTQTGHRYFMYPNLVQNPDAPMIPGAPGLFLDAIGRSAKESTVEWTSGTYKVLTRLGTNDNLYMGDYVIKPADSLTKAEWTAQTPAMRNRWCLKLSKKDWGRITRTRIALRRRFGRNPTFDEVDTAIGSDQKFKNITPSDISKAFDCGDERLAVWTMKCVDYDEQFQRDLVRQITGWVPPPPKSRKPKLTLKPKPKSGATVKSAAQGASTRRRVRPEPKRALTVESEDESD